MYGGERAARPDFRVHKSPFTQKLHQPRSLVCPRLASTTITPRRAMPGAIVHTVFWKWNGSQPADFIAQLRTAAQGMVGACLCLAFADALRCMD